MNALFTLGKPSFAYPQRSAALPVLGTDNIDLLDAKHAAIKELRGSAQSGFLSTKNAKNFRHDHSAN